MSIDLRLGEYYDIASPLHACDARIKLVLAFSYVLSCVFVSTIPELLVAAAVLGIVLSTSHIPLSLVLRQMKPVLFLMILTSGINLLFIQTGTPLIDAGFLHVTSDGVLYALLYTLRFAFLIAASILLLLTTTQSELCGALEDLCAPLAHLGLHVHQLIFTLSLALRFVPILSEEFISIQRAQRTRGAQTASRNPLKALGALMPLVIPLLASCLRHAENLSRAMESRCYLACDCRSSYRQHAIDPVRDGAFCILFIIYVGLLFVM